MEAQRKSEQTVEVVIEHLTHDNLRQLQLKNCSDRHSRNVRVCYIFCRYSHGHGIGILDDLAIYHSRSILLCCQTEVIC